MRIKAASTQCKASALLNPLLWHRLWEGGQGHVRVWTSFLLSCIAVGWFSPFSRSFCTPELPFTSSPLSPLQPPLKKKLLPAVSDLDLGCWLALWKMFNLCQPKVPRRAQAVGKGCVAHTGVLGPSTREQENDLPCSIGPSSSTHTPGAPRSTPNLVWDVLGGCQPRSLGLLPRLGMLGLRVGAGGRVESPTPAFANPLSNSLLCCWSFPGVAFLAPS